MKNSIQNIGWLLRRTHNTKLISNFYENVIQVPIIRTHDKNLIHWCGGTTVLGFNKVSNQNNLIEDNGNFIATYKVRSISKFKELRTLVYEYKDKKENEIRELNDKHGDLKFKIENNQKNYEKLIDQVADEISNFVEKANLEN